MKQVFFAITSIAALGCLTTVDERWCGPGQPCTAGFVCTPDFHCIRPMNADAGTDAGTGGGRQDGGTGGGAGGGAGGGGGGMGGGAGGGTAQCGMASCGSGCCLGSRCMLVNQQGNNVCGVFGNACRACGLNEACVSGQCRLMIDVDAGASSQIGGPCTGDSDCGTDGLGFCIPEVSGGQPTGYIGGYCSRLCVTVPCPSGARCIQGQTQGGGMVSICLAACTTQANCRQSYRCESSGGGVCMP